MAGWLEPLRGLPPLVWLLVVALAAVLGLAAGRRRRRAASPPSLEASLGLAYLVSDQLDRALEAFSRVAASDSKSAEVALLLGNLHREKGQVERAIHIHRGLLARKDLVRRERVLALFCLALDYHKGGFIDRAVSTLRELLELDPGNREALGQLEKLYERTKDWSRAYEAARTLRELQGSGDERVLAFLRNQIGENALKDGDLGAAQGHFEGALAHDRRCVPAALNLGQLHLAQRKFKRAKALLEEVLDRDPRRLGLVWRRLLEIYRALGEEGRLEELCERRVAADPDDWRAILVLGELAEERRDHDTARERYESALKRNPQAFSIHHRLLGILAKTKAPPEQLRGYLDLWEEAMTVADRYVCLRCHYRAGELLWRCPSCQEWDAFVEEG